MAPGWSLADLFESLNAANKGAGFVFCARGGTVTQIAVPVAQSVGTPPNYRVGLVTLNTWGEATTTGYGGSAATVTPLVPGVNWVTLSSPVAVTAGDFLAAQAWDGPVAPTIGNYVSVYCSYAIGNRDYTLLPRGERFIGAGTDIRWGYPRGWAVRYDDGRVQGLPYDGYTDSYDSADTPDERGNLITMPFPASCIGAWVSFGYIGLSTSWEVRLYDAADNLLRSRAMVSGELQALCVPIDFNVCWEGIDLDAVDYRLTVLSTDYEHEPLWPAGFTFPTEADKAGAPEGLRTIMTERTDLGAWTDYPDTLMWFGLLLNGMM